MKSSAKIIAWGAKASMPPGSLVLSPWCTE